jgi:membrane associated rhomboid family serine protease
MPGRYQFLPPAARTSWFRIGTFDVNTSALVAGLASISMFVFAADPQLLANLQLQFLNVRRGHLWRLVTWPLVNEPDIWIALTIYIFWMFGSQLEDSIGRRRYLAFLLAITLIPAVFVTVVSFAVDPAASIAAFKFYFPIGGIRFLEIGVFAAFAAEKPHVRFFFGIPGWVMAAIFIGLDALRFTGQRLFGYLLMLVLCVLTALIALRSLGLGSELPSWIPKVPLPKGFLDDYKPKSKAKGSGKVTQARSQARRSKAALHIVENESTLRPIDDIAPHVAAERRRRVDAILDKISSQGMESLTAEERDILQRGGK